MKAKEAIIYYFHTTKTQWPHAKTVLPFMPLVTSFIESRFSQRKERNVQGIFQIYGRPHKRKCHCFIYLFCNFCKIALPLKSSIMINTFPLRNSSKHLLSGRSHLVGVWDSVVIKNKDILQSFIHLAAFYCLKVIDFCPKKIQFF